MSKVSFKKTALLLLAMSASFGAAAYDSSYLSVVKDDAGVQKCIRWKTWYPNKVPNNDRALSDISEMVRVSQDVYDGNGVGKTSSAYYESTYRIIENGRYAMAWCNKLPTPQKPYYGNNN